MRYIIAILLFASIQSFGQVKEFNWLIGTWKEEYREDSLVTFEVWKNDNGFLSSEYYELKGGKKNMKEEVKLIKRGADFYFIPDVAGPQGQVEFKITSFEKDSFTAENPAHDFPQKIIYKRMDKNHLQAFVSRKDNTDILRFFYTKIK